MNPFVGRDRGLGSDFNRVARPLVMQTDRDAAVLQKQFVAAAACVRRSLTVMQNELAFGMKSRLDPQCEWKWIRACEVGDARKNEAVFAIQFRGLAEFARDKFWIFVRVGGFGR